uniref:Mu-like prophage FluMu N-terminal domain-containing protein n=1 Tax=Nitratidesulfovibrio vulgaris (strain DSM 19637 / Miyazaki F) TaxID=883 RepID=B8DKZ0_NITV9
MRYAVTTRKNVECRYRAGLRFSPERAVVDADELGPARMSAILADPVLLAVPLGTPVDAGETEAGAVADAAPSGQDESSTGDAPAAQHTEDPQPAPEAAPALAPASAEVAAEAPAEVPATPASKASDKPNAKQNSKAGR